MTTRWRHDAIRYQPGGCGVLGVLAKDSGPPVRSDEALAAIECAKFRGSKFGAGFAAFRLGAYPHKYPLVRTFVMDEAAYEEARTIFQTFAPQGLQILDETPPDFASASTMATWEALINADESVLFDASQAVNGQLAEDGTFRARVYSNGRYHVTFKGIGYPSDVAEEYHMLDPVLEARMWIAHTRQPTNSPGRYPIWSHPFSVMEWSIVHNGDVSSFGSNIPFLRSYGVQSLVGTDSEVIGYLLDLLVRVEGLSLTEAAIVLTSPYERWWQRMESEHPQGLTEEQVRSLCLDYVGAHLDGPFAVVAGHSDSEDVQMLGVIDRSKFRPLIVGEDADRVYLASEECQVRVLSPKARVWACDPGRFVLATARDGFIETGLAPNRVMAEFAGLTPFPSVAADITVEATGMEYQTLNNEIRRACQSGHGSILVLRARGQRYMGVDLPQGVRLTIQGTPGNCLANFNDGAHIVVYGNCADDVADTMHRGSVVIHGSARDVLGQALQGGHIYVRGDIGNRGAILMREYEDRRPIILVGGRAGNYLGEYMAGGSVAVLGLAELEAGVDAQVVGDFVATGMLGGRIYVRGKVSPGNIGSLPNREDVANYLEVLHLEGLIAPEAYRRTIAEPVWTLDVLEAMLPERALARVRRMYDSKYRLPLVVRYGLLQEEDLDRLQPHIERFFDVFQLPCRLQQALLQSPFTCISAVPRSRKPTDPEPLIEE
jgi:glutamate synthase domain-containing protein 1/glutamate synthase domain-containing protein 3